MSDIALPDPFVPADVDLRKFSYMPLEIRRLLTSVSWIEAADRPRIGHALICLWCESWHQVPAASLPDNDRVLAQMAMCTPKVWASIREKVLAGWVKCSDGLLYHPVVAEKAMEAWEGKFDRPDHAAERSLKSRSASRAKWGDSATGAVKRHERLAEARKKGRHTELEWQSLLTFCGHRCLKCEARGVSLVKDHIIPIYQGGSDGIENIQPLCVGCNSRKGPDRTDHRQDGWRAYVADVVNSEQDASANASAAPYDASDIGISCSHSGGVEMPAQRLPTPRLKGKEGNREGKENKKEQQEYANDDSRKGEPYAFEAGVIRLNAKHLEQWRQAFNLLSLEAELIALSGWAEQQVSWFQAVSATLNKKQTKAKLEHERVRLEATKPDYDAEQQLRDWMVGR